MSREFANTAVIGLGTMGAGIAETLARHGMNVTGVEANEASLSRSKQRIAASVARAVAGGKLSQADADALLARISYSLDLADAASAELVIEAVPEQLELKKSIMSGLDELCSAETILASNTSSLSITDIAVATSNPRRVVGMHFFNPAPVMPLVEVIRTVVADDGVVADLVSFAQSLGKTPIVVGDRAGFIANTLLFGYLNHAVQMLESRYASREDIDAAMVYGCGLPMGPLALMDLIGLDTAYEVLDTMYHQGRDRLHAPAPMLKQMVTAGLLGRKSGRGFYTYREVGSATIVPDAAAAAAPQQQGIPTRAIASVGVVGSGTMANGIAEVFAKSGLAVTLVARSQDKADAGVARIASSLERAVSRGRMDSAARDAALGRITPTADRAALADVDLVVEAVVEDLEVKRALFAELDTICKPGAILATTTSSLPVIECAVATSRPSEVIGMHFFNPAPVMKLVEVVDTVATSADVSAAVVELCRRIGKHPVQCGDRAGFIVNALLFPYLNDAVRMLSEHYATADEIDLAMKNGCGYPMGPFELLDVVGLDVSLAIQKTLYLEFRERGWAPTPMLEQLVTAGYLGRKTKRGFRIYA